MNQFESRAFHSVHQLIIIILKCRRNVEMSIWEVFPSFTDIDILWHTYENIMEILGFSLWMVIKTNGNQAYYKPPYLSFWSSIIVSWLIIFPHINSWMMLNSTVNPLDLIVSLDSNQTWQEIPDGGVTRERIVEWMAPFPHGWRR